MWCMNSPYFTLVKLEPLSVTSCSGRLNVASVCLIFSKLTCDVANLVITLAHLATFPLPPTRTQYYRQAL